ncbi:hypothetical protein ANCDUO_23525 [Ancylostoma duodenale]|uniref:TM2 domain protein n=1 Tax=Ancylostoma duodenale TaxID=51022 RepID=A0A0C2C9F5_9BILA|nr:hypothetical protein ANCDUO_23525 [Ancylostoma duodenale]
MADDGCAGNEVNDGRLADALKARILLMVGGVVGLHKLYLEQVPEAFVYISTGGLLMLYGWVGDMLNIILNLEHEDCLRGFLCWMAGSVTFGRSTSDSLLMVSALAAAVTAGVYIIGNCGREARDLVYMWIGSFSTTFIHLRFIEDHCMRALLFAAVVSTWLGNRTARARTPLHRPFTWKHLVVSATVPGESVVTTSVGSLLYDRFMNEQRAHRFFKNSPALTYSAPSSSDSKKNKPWWELDLVGRAPAWADMAAVFVVDLMYQEMRVLEKRSKIEPLKWVLWRMYLIAKFDAPAFISHEELRNICAKWVKEQAAMRGKRDPSERGKGARDYRFLGTARACDVISK